MKSNAWLLGEFACCLIGALLFVVGYQAFVFSLDSGGAIADRQREILDRLALIEQRISEGNK